MVWASVWFFQKIPMRPELSVVIISAGNSPWIKDIVKCCEMFSKDIIIVSNNQAFITAQSNDSLSTTRWIFRDFKGYGNQKNFGTSLAKFDWIINLDDDELPSNELLNSLRAWKNPSDNIKAFRVRRINFCNESAISWGKWGEDYSIRIYHASCKWDEKIVHEILSAPKRAVQTIHWPIYHFTANQVGDYLKKTKDYRDKRASSLVGKKNVGWSTLSILFSAFIHIEWLEGVNGLYLTLTKYLERN